MLFEATLKLVKGVIGHCEAINRTRKNVTNAKRGYKMESYAMLS